MASEVGGGAGLGAAELSLEQEVSPTAVDVATAHARAALISDLAVAAPVDTSAPVGPIGEASGPASAWRRA